MIKIPCDFNSTIYDISDFVEHNQAPKIYKVSTNYISLSIENGETIYDIDGFDYKLSDFGKSVFLTEKEAIEKIKDLESEGK